jgi:microcystin-dependent protein
MSKRRSLTFLETMTGTVIATIRTAAPTGWLLFNGDTMGSASSGATRASADNQELFLLLWASFTNTDAPVSGGRGVSAAADWAANKTITLPDMQGRTVIGTGTGSGLTARTHGAKLGTETHVLTEAEMPTHGHQIYAGTGTTSANAVDAGGSTARGFGGSTSSTGLGSITNFPASSQAAIRTTGSGSAHANMQPSMALNWIVKI